MSREKAKELLVGWMQVAIGGCVVDDEPRGGLDPDSLVEIASIVDEIVDAAVSEAIGRLIAVANAAGAKGDQ
ncbi:MAG TPA: hypothetical protein DCQ64_11025 [Candidatus Rokubacteria bacterium]|nr:hypothetical protein [Candidatus Rokubacteria bacterium]